MRFISATEIPSPVTLGAATSGSSSVESAVTAMTEFSVVRGSWARAIDSAGRKSLVKGMVTKGIHGARAGRSDAGMVKMAMATPATKASRA